RFQVGEHLEDARLATRGRHATLDLIGRGDDGHAIEVRETDVGEGRGEALRVPELSAAAESHRCGAVDDDVDRQVLLFLVEAHEEAPEPLVYVPVEITEVVAGHVVAVIGELDARSALLGPALRAHATREDATTDDREVVELALEVVVEKLL